jgi:nascent polypeptide-associated complex subunit alpha
MSNSNKMMPGMNPKKMKKMMSKMGISQEDIQADRVIIEQEDKNLVIENPDVAKVSMKGKETYQITGGNVTEEEKSNFNEEDVQQVMEKADCNEEEAEEALQEADGDLAEAIMNLSE